MCWDIIKMNLIINISIYPYMDIYAKKRTFPPIPKEWTKEKGEIIWDFFGVSYINLYLLFQKAQRESNLILAIIIYLVSSSWYRGYRIGLVIWIMMIREIRRQKKRREAILTQS
jgi:hypothetical protein